jgi:hypothetical protein
MRRMSPRLRLVRITAILVALSLPSTGFAKDRARSEPPVGVVVGSLVQATFPDGRHIAGVVHDISSEFIVVEYTAGRATVLETMPLQTTQTVIKPSVVRWWNKVWNSTAVKVVTLAVAVAGVVVILLMAAAGGQ